MRWAFVACLAGAGLAVGCGSSGTTAEEATSSGVVNTTPPVGIEIQGGNAEQRALLGEILAGLGVPKLVRVAVREPDPVWNYAEPGDVEVVVEDAKGSGERGWWEAWVVAYSFADRSEDLSLPRVVAGTVGGDGSLLVGPDEPPPRGPCREITHEEAATLAAAHGAELLSFERLAPGRPAFALTIRVDDGARFLSNALDQVFTAVGSRGCAGSYLEVVDAEGPAWAGGTAESNGETRFSHEVRKGLEGCDWPPGFPMDESYMEPTCPA